MSTRYSKVVASRGLATAIVEPSRKEAIIKLLDSETLVIEAVENLVRFEDLESHDAADALIGDAMRRLAQAREMLHAVRRRDNGLPVTIASVG